LCQPAPMAD